MAAEPLRHLVQHLPVDPDVDERADAHPLPHRITALLVAVGGVGGSLLRALLERVVPPSGGWAWGTLFINISGAALLALLLVVLGERVSLARVLRPLLGTGVLGGYTTFSTFAVETVQLTHRGHHALAGLYVAASTVGALGAALGGAFAGRSLSRLTNRARRLRHADLALDSEDAT